jgi:hypothetical protein
MAWLADGVPITLLCDLLARSGPDSDAINCRERPANDTIWLDAAAASRPAVRSA